MCSISESYFSPSLFLCFLCSFAAIQKLKVQTAKQAPQKN